MEEAIIPFKKLQYLENMDKNLSKKFNIPTLSNKSLSKDNERL